MITKQGKKNYNKKMIKRNKYLHIYSKTNRNY